MESWLVLALTKGSDLAEAAGVFVGGAEILLDVSMVAAAYLDMNFMDYWQSEHGALHRIAKAMLRSAEL